jgi:hypothetical protein
MEEIRNAYINLWNVMFGNDAMIPEWLKTYSLKANFPAMHIAERVPLHDKQVSVRLSETLKSRYEYCVFHRTFDGSDPLAASQRLAAAVSRLKKPIHRK